MKKLLLGIFTLLFFVGSLSAQAPKKLNSTEIYNEVEKLNFLGTVLYVAAHPDDENTRMISYFANEVHARTAYLSLTRGDGGQNLIGPEIRELLGVIRTNELLQARATDGGEQFFTRANDFGYSKHPDETLALWNKEEVLNDVVRVIREFQPDVIINRFDAESAGRTHGHHTSSAMLSLEAFDLAGSDSYKTGDVGTWQPKRIFFNTHWWFYGSREKFEEVDKSDMLWVDIGTYYEQRGLSNSEIASASRSMHKSQGFGSTGTRGSEKEYLHLLKGDMPDQEKGIFDGVDTTWNRVKGGAEIGSLLEEVQRNFDFRDPSKSVPALVKAYELIQKLEDEHWRIYKSREIKDVIAACLGLYLEGVASSPYATAGENVPLKIESINRSPGKVSLNAIRLMPEDRMVEVEQDLENNQPFRSEETFLIPEETPSTSPYWLNDKGTLGMYKVEDEDLIGMPTTPRRVSLVFDMLIEGVPIRFERAIVYKYNDPVKGEVYQPFEVVPQAAASIRSKVVLFDDGVSKEIPVTVTAGKDDLAGEVSLKAPEGWAVAPEAIEFNSSKRGEKVEVTFVVTPTQNQSEGKLEAVVNIGEDRIDRSLVEIDYDHIPKQMIYLPSESKVVRLDMKIQGKEIGYINGAGDEIPKYLRQIGYNVTEIDPGSISEQSLKSFDAVIVGIRAYNTVSELSNKQQALFSYVEQGGNLIVQYNTSHRLVTQQLAPYPLELSRKRITDEQAPVTLLRPEHELMNLPNKIDESDFEGWVQERGLYFPDKWGEEFTPLLSFRENGEDPMEGSLLVAEYGKGHYIYTGLSFFRELPAGVPGAYKLFVNMISIGKNQQDAALKK